MSDVIPAVVPIQKDTALDVIYGVAYVIIIESISAASSCVYSVIEIHDSQVLYSHVRNLI